MKPPHQMTEWERREVLQKRYDTLRQLAAQDRFFAQHVCRFPVEVDKANKAADAWAASADELKRSNPWL